MRMRRLIGGIAVALGLGLASPVLASEQTANPDTFQQTLSTYDPQAVQAATEYVELVNLKSILEQAVPKMAKALAEQVKAKNPKLSDEQAQAFVDAFEHSALVDNAEVFQRSATIMMLEIYRTHEIMALRDFYSSPVGRAVIGKMPTMISRMPELMQLLQTYIEPHALEAARQAMKARGVDVEI